MAESKIVLHPKNPWAILQDPFLLVETVRSRGLVGAAFSHFGELHYRAGPRFRELVAFRSASPSPGADLHVSVVETLAEASFLGGANVQAPQCPGCQGRFVDWKARLTEWQADRRRYVWACRRCGRSLRVDELDWLRTGGVARYALELWGVREGEAEPSGELLELLNEAIGEPWAWFYYRL